MTSSLKTGYILIIFESLGCANIDFLITFLALSGAKRVRAVDYYLVELGLLHPV